MTFDLTQMLMSFIAGAVVGLLIAQHRRVDVPRLSMLYMAGGSQDGIDSGPDRPTLGRRFKDQREVVASAGEPDSSHDSGEVATAGESHVTLTVRLKDLDRTKLLVYQLHELRSRMVVASDPFATDLDRIIDRYLAGGDDEESEAISA